MTGGIKWVKKIKIKNYSDFTQLIQHSFPFLFCTNFPVSDNFVLLNTVNGSADLDTNGFSDIPYELNWRFGYYIPGVGNLLGIKCHFEFFWLTTKNS